MRIYWYQGGLHIDPESSAELEMLDHLIKSTKLGRSEERASLVAGEQIAERDVPGKASNERAA